MIKKYVKNFFNYLGYKNSYKEDFDEQNFIEAYSIKYDQQVFIDDLKSSKTSKTFKNNLNKVAETRDKREFFNKDSLKFVLKSCLKERKQPIVKANDIIQLVSQTVLSKNKVNLLGENMGINYKYPRLSYKSVDKEMNIIFKRDKWLNAKVKNKTPQTPTPTGTMSDEKYKSKELKENWILRKRNLFSGFEIKKNKTF